MTKYFWKFTIKYNKYFFFTKKKKLITFLNKSPRNKKKLFWVAFKHLLAPLVSLIRLKCNENSIHRQQQNMLLLLIKMQYVYFCLKHIPLPQSVNLSNGSERTQDARSRSESEQTDGPCRTTSHQSPWCTSGKMADWGEGRSWCCLS